MCRQQIKMLQYVKILPVSGYDTFSLVQFLFRCQQVYWIGDYEEMLGSSNVCGLVKPRSIYINAYMETIL